MVHGCKDLRLAVEHHVDGHKDLKDQVEDWEVLSIIQFSSHRKRMTIVARPSRSWSRFSTI